MLAAIVSMWKLRPNGVHFRCCGPCDPPLTVSISPTQQRQQSERLKKNFKPHKNLGKEGNNCWIKNPATTKKSNFIPPSSYSDPAGGPLVDNLATFSSSTFLRLHYSLHLPSRPPAHTAAVSSFFLKKKKIQKKEGKNPLAGDWSFSKQKWAPANQKAQFVRRRRYLATT